MRKHTGLTIAAFIAILLVLAAATAPAGGSTESGTRTPEATEGRESTESADSGVPQSPDDVFAALRGLGVQVFRDEIQAQDFTLAVLGGDERSLSDYEGKVVFLNFWATWCGPCVEEMPSMQTLYEEFKQDGLEILAVNLQEAPATVQAFVDEFGYTYPVLLDRRGEVGMNYSVRGIPSTYIVGRDGRLLGMKIGFRLWDEPEVFETFRALLNTL